MRRIHTFISAIVLQCVQMTCSAVCGSPPVARSVQKAYTERYITDAILHRRWAVVMDCNHPERPWTLEEVPWQNTSSLPTIARVRPTVAEQYVPLVPAGAKVRLWQNRDGASIELSGTALESGNAEQMIHVRTGKRGTVLEGRVRGAGSVELFTSGALQHRVTEGWDAR
jgi:hypothetical protein